MLIPPVDLILKLDPELCCIVVSGLPESLANPIVLPRFHVVVTVLLVVEFMSLRNGQLLSLSSWSWKSSARLSMTSAICDLVKNVLFRLTDITLCTVP